MLKKSGKEPVPTKHNKMQAIIPFFLKININHNLTFKKNNVFVEGPQDKMENGKIEKQKNNGKTKGSKILTGL